MGIARTRFRAQAALGQPASERRRWGAPGRGASNREGVEPLCLSLDELTALRELSADVLVNNAGIMRRASAEEMTIDAWRDVVSVNLDGTFYWSTEVARRSMLPRRTGAIVNVASLAGLVGIPSAAPYVASKHAVVGLTKALAVDWGQYNIRINAICPGMTWSNLSKADLVRNPDMFVERERRIPLGHAAEPDEQAQTILFLASKDASYVHGSIVSVDGGQLALSSGHVAPRCS